MRVSRAFLAVLLVAVAAAIWTLAFARSREPDRLPVPADVGPAGPTLPYEEWARREFERRHPGEKPLNWEIALKAEEFHLEKPMGRFVLDRNDCTDFVDAIVDDALGAEARFRRGSDEHVLPNKKIWEAFYWDRRTPLQPGDRVTVRHSPWYEPSEEAPWHLAVIGTDGMAYDWTKLRSWAESGYGRNSLEWFARNSPGPKEVLVQRLAPEYRYRIKPLPIARGG